METSRRRETGFPASGRVLLAVLMFIMSFKLDLGEKKKEEYYEAYEERFQ